MAGTGLDGTAKMEAFSLLNGFIAQFAQWERTASAGARRQAEFGAYLYGAATSGEYPNAPGSWPRAAPPSTPRRCSHADCTGSSRRC